jgi:hypothetical protein
MNVTVKPLDRKRINPADWHPGPVTITASPEQMDACVDRLLHRYGLNTFHRMLMRGSIQLIEMDGLHEVVLDLAGVAKHMSLPIPLTQCHTAEGGALKPGIQCKACGRSLSAKADPELCSVCLAEIWLDLQNIRDKEMLEYAEAKAEEG